MMRADAQRNLARVLEAAEEVLARDGLSAPMREIARQAGVGVGTIYRQFPTKEALYQAIVVDRKRRLAEEARALSTAAEPGPAFFAFFARVVEDATAKKVFADALSEAGIDVKAATAGTYDIRGAIETLLTRAQRADQVRAEVGMPELLALLTATCLAAQHQGWDERLRTSTLEIVFNGLRP
ncbi:helix-turn-helix domain-containing protein [Streptosporangium sp. NPDC051023]|uniref:TetR/AcrR family transcriptional regulator n=1 Tax=Streptosporangium sp. NPDC051023 TaxID=3155410 RepID=UPI00344D7956